MTREDKAPRKGMQRQKRGERRELGNKGAGDLWPPDREPVSPPEPPQEKDTWTKSPRQIPTLGRTQPETM